ncbi:TPA: hypothetical protein R4K73_000691 [Campylobacter coli]|nr:hypothetical protein [Campylobacter coli]HED0616830.1 hypothetical protein [Campylobacter coli]
MQDASRKYLVVLHTMINYSVESYGLFGDEREVGSFTSVGHKGVCRRKNKISIWKNKTSIKVEILFFYKP